MTNLRVYVIEIKNFALFRATKSHAFGVRLVHLASISGSYAFMCKPHAYWPFRLIIIIEALFPCTC